jgi:adenosylmethionine-8-amino-7-oxononanoate aminotransferase
MSDIAESMSKPQSELPTSDLIEPEQSVGERHLRQIFVRSQMTDFVKDPFVVARADGVHYWDVHGKKYLDALSGIYVASVGHNNRRVIDAVKRQMDVLNFSPPMHGTNPLSIRLANKLVEAAPGDLSAVKLASGGSESTETAISIARQFHKLRGQGTKYKIISRYQSWHGATLGALSASGVASRRAATEPLAGGFVHVFPPTCYRCPFGKSYPSCEMTCATLIEDVIEMEGPETVAALMVEPIGHTGGIIDPPEEYLPLLREICDRHGVLLIFDEIITGMGRTGHLFAAETFGVVPDMLCVGKGLAAGYAPIFAVLLREHIANTFWGDAKSNPGLVSGHTFEGNPTACAAALAALAEVEERDLCANARRMGERLRERLEGLRRHNIIGDIRGKGLFLGIEFVRNVETKERYPVEISIGNRIGRKALENGLLTRYDPHWIGLGPALIITEEHVDQIVDILDQSIAEVLAEPGVLNPV